MIEIFDTSVETAWLWLGAGLVLVLAELATGSLFLLWPGVAAILFAGLVALAPGLLEPTGQILAYAAFAAALTIAGRAWFAGRPADAGRPGLNRPGQALIGRQVSARGPFRDGVGAVTVADGQWAARLENPSGGYVADGARLVVVGVEGAQLVVRPA